MFKNIAFVKDAELKEAFIGDLLIFINFELKIGASSAPWCTVLTKLLQNNGSEAPYSLLKLYFLYLLTD